MKILLTIIFLTISTVSFGQHKRYIWPYLKGATPRYLSLYSGIAGRDLNQLEFGLGFHIPRNAVGGAINSLEQLDSIAPKDRGIGFGFIGPTLNYRKDLNNDIEAIALGFSIKSGINMGVDFITYRKLEEVRYSIKPQIGLYIFHINLEYGFNIFLNKEIPELKRGDFRIGLNIPLINLIKNKDEG